MRKKLPTQNWTKKKRKRKRPLPCRRLTFSSSFPSRHRPLVTASPLGGALWRVKYDNTIRNKQRNIKKEEEKGKNRAKKIVVGVINTFVGRTMPSALKWLKQVGPTKTLQRLYFPSFLFLFSQLFCFISPEQKIIIIIIFNFLMNQKYYYWNKQTKIIEKTKSQASDQQQRKNSKEKRGSDARRVCKQNHTQKITNSHLTETKICVWTIGNILKMNKLYSKKTNINLKIINPRNKLNKNL